MLNNYLFIECNPVNILKELQHWTVLEREREREKKLSDVIFIIS